MIQNFTYETDTEVLKEFICEAQYFRVHKCPPEVDLLVYVGNKTNDPLIMTEGDEFTVKSMSEIFISSTAHINGVMQFIGSSSDEIDFNLSPTMKFENDVQIALMNQDVNNVSLISAFSQTLLDSLDKIANPYTTDDFILAYPPRSSIYTDLFNGVCDFDSVKLLTTCIDDSIAPTMIFIFIDGVRVDYQTVRYNDEILKGQVPYKERTYKNLRGKTLLIQYQGYINIYSEKHTLKS